MKPEKIWKRLLAKLIDYIVFYVFSAILLVSIIALAYVFGFIVETNEERIPLFATYFLLGSIIYGSLAEYYTSTTFGKLILGSRVTSFSGNNISFKSSFIRNIAIIQDVFLIGIFGILSVARSELNQRCGDRYAKTIVINKKFATNKIQKLKIKDLVLIFFALLIWVLPSVIIIIKF